MKHHSLSTLFAFIICAAQTWAQEPWDVEGTKEELQKIDQEQHYPIKVTFRVIDEAGQPVEGADMHIRIDSRLHGDRYNDYKGKSDKNGLFTVESRGLGCEGIATMNGCYTSSRVVKWDGALNPGGPEMHANGGFRPWNPTVDLMLKKIGKPIPMIVRLNDWAAAPIHEKDLGWDLVEADWLPPHGKGKVADWMLTFDGKYSGTGNYFATMVLRFPNPNDGLIPIERLIGEESTLRFPRNAPEDCYVMKNYRVSLKSVDGKYNKEPQVPPKGFVVRFRTEVDKDGKVVSARYGKITDWGKIVTPIEIYPPGVRRPTVSFLFSSYLNPTPNSRNLEYDRTHNLAPDAPTGVTWDP